VPNVFLTKKGMGMILYPSQGAGMCNRLWATAHLIAHVEETGNSLVFGNVFKYRRYFEGLFGVKSCFFESSNKRSRNLLRVPFCFLRSGVFPPGEISFEVPEVVRAEKAAILALAGWRFRDEGALEKHGDTVRRIFTPRESYRKIISESVNPLKAQCDRLVGIHVRQGDYARFRNGRYLYSDQVYSRVMREVAEQLPGITRFLLSSDEPIAEGRFKGFSFRRCVGQELVDLYSLAQCDYILGPPSTYSAWASFYGKVPLFHIDTPDTQVTFESFSKPK